MIGYKKLIVKGNMVILPEGKGKDKIILEKALFLLKGIYADKIGKKLEKPKRDR
ncbi:MAG: hypothetical protein ACFFDY_00550 [Candidatus Thorarchaeota archaeon]